ncbi:MAG: sugar ABC transporter permease [Acidisphaera sp.]|nr:sugar ABC transporter permease [Acidisphaera sp.]
MRRRVGYDRPAFAYLLNLPSLAAILLLVGYPIASSSWVSLHRYNLKRPRVFAFVGLDNYRDIVGSEEFWSALRVTLIFTVLAVVIVVALGLAVALLLSQAFPGRGLVRALILIPWAIPPVVNGLMWQWIYDPKIGALNALLRGLGLIREYQGWLSDPGYAVGGLLCAHVWNEFPLAAILLMGALQRVPGDLYDAGRVDGCKARHLFRHVTLPWLSQTLLVVLILQTMLAIRVFDIIYVLTAGGPGTATTTLAWQTYLTTFTSLDFGHGSAYAYIITLITLGLALAYFRILYGRGEFEA